MTTFLYATLSLAGSASLLCADPSTIFRVVGATCLIGLWLFRGEMR